MHTCAYDTSTAAPCFLMSVLRPTPLPRCFHASKGETMCCSASTVKHDGSAVPNNRRARAALTAAMPSLPFQVPEYAVCLGAQQTGAEGQQTVTSHASLHNR